MKVQKLLYYSQGWHVTLTGARLFDEPIEAWEKGPVVAEVWRAEKHDKPAPPAAAPSDEETRVIDYVVRRYGNLSGNEMSALTHAATPWLDAWSAGPSTEITPDALAQYFSEEEIELSSAEEVERAEREAASAEAIRRTGRYTLEPRALSPEERAIVDEAKAQR